MKSLQSRFESKFERITESGCWVWTAATKEYGYGVIGLGSRSDGVEKAHRVSYKLYVGEIPKHLNVLHKCGVSSCVNPDHLYLGTLKDNARDTVAMGRHRLPDNRGERAAWSKLKLNEVDEIKALKGLQSATSLAKRFNVSRAAIYNIWSGKSWQRPL